MSQDWEDYSVPPKQQHRPEPDVLPRTSSISPSLTLSQHLPPELLAALIAEARFKDRTEQTHTQVHVPMLQNKLTIELLLLGDSMFERFTTTGCNTILGVANTSYPKTFNAGIGGDKIRNVVYRLVREQGLVECLIECGGAEYIFLEVGTNDLGDGKRPLKVQDIQVYRLMVEALSIACGPRLKALVVCGLNRKRRVKKEEVVQESNILLKNMVREMQELSRENGPSIEYLDADEQIMQHLEEDGVHLDEQGYDIFARRLWEKYEELRRRFAEAVVSAEPELPKTSEIITNLSDT